MKNLIMFAFALTLLGCTTVPIPLPAEPVTTSPTTLALKLKWETGHPERALWSTEIRKLFKENLDSFNSAADVKGYCGKWSTLNSDQKITVLGTMAVAIALYESDYNPGNVYHEPPPLSVDSIGLYQLSYEDQMKWCSMVRASNTLKDPITNIRCAIPEMAMLAKKDGVISGGSSGAWRGLPRYWSTMRPTGKLTQIKSATNSLEFCK